MSINIQITLSESENKQIQKQADIIGLTRAQYIKQKILTDTEFEVRYNFLKKAALNQSKGEMFTVMSLFPDWNELERGMKLSLGRNFYYLVKRGDLSPVRPAKKNSSNVQLYMIGDEVNNENR